MKFFSRAKATSGIASAIQVETIILFGSGLIGASIASALLVREWLQTGDSGFDWNDKDLRELQAAAISAELVKRASDGKGVAIVWAAGQAGFGTDESALQLEWKSFQSVLDIATRTSVHSPVAVHLLSSAGGLFEGQRFVGIETPPAPLRPYGASKIRQEQALREIAEKSEGRVVVEIYRPSTVYGYAPRGRQGLISVLVRNALRGHVSNIFGSPGTLRDFVLSSDIGNYVADRIGAPFNASSNISTWLLASGKATSMTEAIATVRRNMPRQLFLRYDASPSNALDNSYLPSAVAPGFQPTALPVGISQTIRAISRFDLGAYR